VLSVFVMLKLIVAAADVSYVILLRRVRKMMTLPVRLTSRYSIISKVPLARTKYVVISFTIWKTHISVKGVLR
jgi:hypothetical protein